MSVKRISGPDTFLLYSESAHLHQLSVAVAIVDTESSQGKLSFDSFQEMLRQRLDLLEPLRYRLVQVPFQVHHPMWQELADVDLDYHIRRVKLAEPGFRRELDDFVGRVASTSLDFSRPLWEFYFVEGVASGQKVAVIGKAHQALADPVAWANLMAQALDWPDSGAERKVPESGRLPSTVELMRAAARDHAEQLRRLPEAVRIGASGARNRWLRAANTRASTPPELAVRWDPQSSLFSPARSTERAFASAWLPLEELEEAGRLLGVTANDVVLAAAAGALRELLLDYDRRAYAPIVAAVPIIIDSNRNRVSGNAMSTMLVSLPVNFADPLERVRLTRVATELAKNEFERLGPSPFGRFLDYLPPAAARALADRISEHWMDSQPFKVIVGNLPGAPEHCRIAGAKVTQLYSVGPLAAGSALNITTMRYADRLCVSVLAGESTFINARVVSSAVVRTLREIGRAAKRSAGGGEVGQRESEFRESERAVAESLVEEKEFAGAEPLRRPKAGEAGNREKSRPAEGAKGVVEDAKGKAKEAVGSITGRDDLIREGAAQQDKTDARHDALNAPGEPDIALRPRYLQAQMPERVETGRPLSIRVAITLAPRKGSSSALKGFVVPSEGATVRIIVLAPDLVADGDSQHDIHVPADADSEPHLFSFTAGRVGTHEVTVEAFRHGTYLGAVQLQVVVELGAATGSQENVRIAELPSLSGQSGEVTLQVLRVRRGHYRFQLIGDPIHREVEGPMRKADAAVEALVAELRNMAAKQSSYATSELVRRRLRSLGIDLWLSAVPDLVREQFWEQADQITMFSIVTDHDTIPWELLYPADKANDNGFLAQQFPVVRRTYGVSRVTTLPMGSAVYVVPPDSPSNAHDEVNALRILLGNRIGYRGVLSQLSAVSDLMTDPATPGIIHFACHNAFSATSGSSIELEGGPFTPSDLADAQAKKSLTVGHPLVFMNACRSAAQIAWFARMNGWATRFLDAGAGAFIGSLWAVRSSAARAFAEAFYEQFVVERQSLGTSSLLARKAVSEDEGDPTWLAYTIYGNPAAVVAR